MKNLTNTINRICATQAVAAASPRYHFNFNHPLNSLLRIGCVTA